jgi:hypothetical protein
VLGKLSNLIEPDEDLSSAMAPIDRLVTDAHAHGLLPHPDTLSRYRAAKETLDPSAMSVYRDVASAYKSGMPPQSIWLARQDPLPILNALFEYVSVTGQVMNHIEAMETISSENLSETDAAGVIASLTILADEVDGLLKDGV